MSQMKHEKYQFSPWVFPWCFTNITHANVLVRMCAIANGLQLEAVMDELAERLSDLDGADSSRVSGVRLLLSRPTTPKRREILIQTMGDKETYTRKEAFGIAKKILFTPEEYDRMCELLRFKAADLRLNILSLLKEPDSQGRERSLTIFLKEKREEMHLAGLYILRGMVQEAEENEDEGADLLAVIETGKKLTLEIQNPTKRERISISEIFQEEKSAVVNEVTGAGYEKIASVMSRVTKDSYVL